MKYRFNSGVSYSAGQRAGLLLLFLLMIITQLLFFLPNLRPKQKMPREDAAWVALERRYDSVVRAKEIRANTIYPFNPNFLTDYRGYKLGLSVAELDRLFAFRKTGRYVNSANEFQKVTGVSDSLLAKISPYFKFPDWVVARNNKESGSKQVERPSYARKEIVVQDINKADKEQLVAVYGIGDALSDRILKAREQLGGFVSMEQMQYIWGLSPEVVSELQKRFRVMQVPEVRKIAINSASLKELSAFPYFRYKLAREIVTYRSMEGKIASSEDLVKINGFPAEKVHFIALYLEF